MLNTKNLSKNDYKFLLSLSGYLMVKFAHDMAGPIGSVYNGVLLYKDAEDKESENDMFDSLINEGAESLFYRIKFLRKAYGVIEKINVIGSISSIHEFLEKYILTKNATLKFSRSKNVMEIRDNFVQLFFNIIIFVLEAIGKNKEIDVNISNKDDENVVISISAVFSRSGLNCQFMQMLQGKSINHEQVDEENVHNIYVNLLAQYLSIKMSVNISGYNVDIKLSDSLKSHICEEDENFDEC